MLRNKILSFFTEKLNKKFFQIEDTLSKKSESFSQNPCKIIPNIKIHISKKNTAKKSDYLLFIP